MLTLTVFGAWHCNLSFTKELPEARATAYPVDIPVLKGLVANPILRITISLPLKNDGLQIQTLRVSLNPSSLKDIQTLDVYQTGAEPFSSNTLLARTKPSSPGFDIPVATTSQSSLFFLWISIVLTPEADINHLIELHCEKIVFHNGEQLRVNEQKGNYTKRCGVVVRKAGDDKVNTYRIPGIVQTDKGTLIAVYDNRYNNSRDLPEDIDIGMSRSIDSGRSWQPMKVIMDMGTPHANNGVGDPAILFDPATKEILVAALWSKGNRSIAGSGPGLAPDSTGQFMLVSSTDDGLTWSAPRSITKQVKRPAWNLFFNGPGMGIAMSDGKLVFAAQYWDENKMPFATIIYSEDHGKTWKGNIAGPKANTTESQVAEISPGMLMLNMRDNRGGYRSIATTKNMGSRWTEHSTSFSALPDPVCMGSLLKATVNVSGSVQEVLFFSNPNTSHDRYNITIKASLDLGQTWLPAHQLLIDERDSFGYSCLTKIDDHTIGILYEGIKDLFFVKVPVSAVLTGK